MGANGRSEAWALWFAGVATLLAAVGIWFNYADQYHRQQDIFEDSMHACADAVSEGAVAAGLLFSHYSGMYAVPATATWDAYGRVEANATDIRAQCIRSGLVADSEVTESWERAVAGVRGGPVLLPLEGPGVSNSPNVDTLPLAVPKLDLTSINDYEDALGQVEEAVSDANAPTWFFWTWDY